MKRSVAGAMLVFCVALVAFASCSGKRADTAGTRTPPVYDGEALSAAQDLLREAGTLMDGDDVEGALAKIGEAFALVPSTIARDYNEACVYARAGEKEKAFARIDRLLDDGYDLWEYLEYDPDLDALRDDPRMAGAIAAAKTNFETGSAIFAKGFPPPGDVPPSVGTVEALDEWRKEQDRLRGLHRWFRTDIEHLTATVATISTWLAARAAIAPGDAEFDAGLERVAAAYRLRSPYSPGWGGASDLVVAEADAFLATRPSKEKTSQARYEAGAALTCKYAYDDPRRVGAFEQAAAYFAKVDESSEFHGAALMTAAINANTVPGSDEESLKRELVRQLETFAGDERARRVVSVRFGSDAAAMLWPIPLEAADIDGASVSLDEYRGKAVLVDFWATWCAPCRREIPGMVEMYGRYHDRGFEILSISLDSPERMNEAAFREWIAGQGMTWRHVYDGDAWNSPLVRSFFVGSIPAPYLVGPDGSLVAWGDECRQGKLAANVEKALAAAGR